MNKFFIKYLIDSSAYLFGKNKLNILTYHRVGDSGSAVAMTEALFEQHLLWLKRYFNPIDLAEGIKLQKEGKLPPRSVAITIDDGYVDSYKIIFPLLQKYQLQATFFISTAGLEAEYLWDELVAYNIMNTPIKTLEFNNVSYELTTQKERITCLMACLDKIKYHSVAERNALIEHLLQQTKQLNLADRFLTKEQISLLHKSGMGIGAHTHNHPILNNESDDFARKEIEQSKDVLEKIIKEPIHYFAYPNGKYTQDFENRHIEMVQSAGFKAAFSTDWGVLSDFETECFQIKRFTPWNETELRFALRLALNYCT